MESSAYNNIIEAKLEEILPLVKQPGRYIGKEWNSVEKDWSGNKLSVALAFPDTYEIGMSHLGLNILYNVLNEKSWIIAERVYSPWIDMERELRNNDLPLFSLESKTPLEKFDIIAFTLQYELTYTNILNLLDLGRVPVKKKERNAGDPIIIAGGPNAFMPEPLADFIDVFVIGEGEEVMLELMELAYKKKMSCESFASRDELLDSIKNIEGIYVPEYYMPYYDSSGYYRGIKPLKENISERIRKRVIKDFDSVRTANNPLVPNVKIVHDRAAVELFRGCGKGCRFCQAGMIYRPVRERSFLRAMELASKFLEETGYEELSLTSLSSADYSEIESLVDELNEKFRQKSISISLPSLRIDSFSVDLLKKVQTVKKTGLTFAPEAGSQRLRNVINKKVTENDLLNASRAAFEAGWHTLKLYFMIGLPTETYKDLDCMVDLVYKVVDLYKQVNGNLKRFKLNVSSSIYVPKPHTPFQWLGQASKDEIIERQDYLKKKLEHKSINYSWDDPDKSFLEAFLAKADRRAGEVIYQAYLNGARLDGWGEIFDMKHWDSAFEKTRLDPYDIVNRSVDLEKPLPWEHIDSGVSKDYLIKEYKKALEEDITGNCKNSTKCDSCGVCTIL